MLFATWGLVAFRKGLPEQGRQLYAAAVDHFTRMGSKTMAARAELYWLCEESRLGDDSARERAGRILDSIKDEDFGWKAVASSMKRRLSVPQTESERNQAAWGA
jgi:hypothetical protein